MLRPTNTAVNIIMIAVISFLPLVVLFLSRVVTDSKMIKAKIRVIAQIMIAAPSWQ
jgi:uncharacterized membrane protein